MTRQTEEPLDALYHHFGIVTPPTVPAGTNLPPTLALIIRQAHSILPTHILALLSTDPEVAPILVPTHASLLVQYFNPDTLPPLSPTPSPSPPPSPNGSLTLPLVPLRVPHPQSLPLLLLFALRLRPSSSLPWALLPPSVIEEFPSAAAMAQLLARSSPGSLGARAAHNKGLWANVLALAPKDAELVALVQTAWNVTAEARRIQSRGSGDP